MFQHFEQARHHHHHGGAHFLDIAGELVQAFGIIDFAAETDGDELAGGVFVGVGWRQERQEHVAAVFGEIIGHDIHRARDIVQDGAVVLADAARGAAGAGGVNQAGEIAALHFRARGHGFYIGRVGGEEGCHIQHGDVAGLPELQRLDADDGVAVAGLIHGFHQHAGELVGGNDRGDRAAVFEDVQVIAAGVGGVGGDGDGLRCHDREIPQAEFRAVFGDEHDAITGLDAVRHQRIGQRGDDFGRALPAGGVPAAILFAPQEGGVAQHGGLAEEHLHEVGPAFDAGGIDFAFGFALALGFDDVLAAHVAVPPWPLAGF